MSIRDLQAAPQLAEDMVPLRLLGSAGAEHRSLERRLQAITGRERESFSGSGEAAEVAARMRKIEDAAGLTEFHIRALDRTRPLVLLREHVPVTDDEKQQGFADSYLVALVTESCFKVVDPDGTEVPAEEITWWDNIFASLSWGQFETLRAAVDALNGNDTTLPTSALASRVSQIRDESSNKPKRGGSRRSGGGAGSRPGSQKSSETKPDESFA